VSNEDHISNVELEVFKRELKRREEDAEKDSALSVVLDSAQSKAQELLDVLNNKWENMSHLKNPYDLAKVNL